MADTYEIQSPYGILEMQSEHPPTAAQAAAVVRAYSDSVAAKAQKEASDKGSPFAAPTMENVGRFVGGAAEMLNPMGIVSAVQHPIETAKNLVGAQVDQARKAVTEGQAGHPLEAAGHGMAALIPVIGPAAANAGEQIGQGDVAGGLGKGAGILAPFALGSVMRLKNAANPQAADILTREAEQQVSGKVLAPGNPAYRGRAAAIAPEVLARKLSGNRLELQQAAEEGMADAGSKLDDAIQASGGVKAPVPVSEVVQNMKGRIADLQDSNGQPLSGQAAIRIQALRDRLMQVQSLGRKTGTATFEDLRKIRDENYRVADEARGYQKQGNPAMADEGWAARETGGAIRDAFAKRSPESAAANADYTFWKTLNDVLDPVLGRPKSTAAPAGVTGGSRTVGAVVGSMISPKAALVMSTVVPWLRDRMASPSWQLADAQTKLKLAAAMKRGDLGTIKTTLLRLEAYKPQDATSPSGLQSQTTESGSQP